MGNWGIWFIGGAIAITLCYLIPGFNSELWWPLWLAGGCALAVVLTVMVKLWKSRRERSLLLPVIAILALFLFSVIGAARSYQSSLWKRDNLFEIRANIDEAVILSALNEVLLTMLDDYYKNDGLVGFDRLFDERYGEQLLPDNTYRFDIYQEETQPDSPVLKLIHNDPDRLQMIAYSVVGIGDNPDYETRYGQPGRIEIIGTVTKEGVEYEYKN